MTREGEPYDRRVCGGEHTTKVNPRATPAIFGFVEYYVECPEYGEIVWTENP